MRGPQQCGCREDKKLTKMRLSEKRFFCLSTQACRLLLAVTTDCDISLLLSTTKGLELSKAVPICTAGVTLRQLRHVFSDCISFSFYTYGS